MDGIPSKELTVGDIVQIRMGEIIPADMRLIETEQLKVSETPLTGESADVKKNPDRIRTEESINNPDAGTADTNNDNIDSKNKGKKKGVHDNDSLTPANCIFSSCIATEGSGIGVVIGIGMNTRVGRIAALLESTNDDDDLQVEHSVQDSTTGNARNNDAAEQSRSVHLDINENENNGTTNHVAVDKNSNTTHHTAATGTGTDTEGLSSSDDDGKKKKKKKKRSLGYRIKAKLGLRTKQTPLQRSIGKLGTYMGLVGVAAAVLVFAIGLGRDHKDPDYRDSPVWLQMLLVSVSLAVGVIPEGLPIVTTVSKS
jgi:magnesium-transporting ATPase (P-type)